MDYFLVNHNRDLFDVFNPILNYDISISNLTFNLIKTLKLATKQECAKECSLERKCILILTKENKCNLYNKIDYADFVPSPGSAVLMKKYIDDMSSINANLINHWPFNNNLDDIIGGSHMINGINYVFSTDRLNTPYSAVYLNNGYIQLPDGIYFDGDFTISVWVKVRTHRYCSRIVDFGGTAHQDNVCFGLGGMKSLQILLLENTI